MIPFQTVLSYATFTIMDILVNKTISFLKWNLILTLSQFLGENYWKNPEKFDPNRFFDTNGKLNIPEAFIPFGLGMFLI